MMLWVVILWRPSRYIDCTHVMCLLVSFAHRPHLQPKWTACMSSWGRRHATALRRSNTSFVTYWPDHLHPSISLRTTLTTRMFVLLLPSPLNRHCCILGLQAKADLREIARLGNGRMHVFDGKSCFGNNSDDGKAFVSCIDCDSTELLL